MELNKLKGTSEKRAFTVPDIRAIEGENVIEGHAAVFGEMTNICGWFNEIIDQRAFDNTDFKDVLFSVNHDLQKIPIARSRNNNANSTLQLWVDEKGLAVKAHPDCDNNSEAKALYSSVKRGDMNGMSFIFRVKEEKWDGLDTDMPTRTILAVERVIEVSAVSFPAYPGTDINARDKSALDSAKLVLENAKRQELDSSESEKRNNDLEVLKLRTKIKSKI